MACLLSLSAFSKSEIYSCNEAFSCYKKWIFDNYLLVTNSLISVPRIIENKKKGSLIKFTIFIFYSC